MRPSILAALSLWLVCACGGNGDPQSLADAGETALGSGKYEDAAESYEKALTKIGSDTTHPDWKRSKMGWLKAQAHLDASKAKDEFLAVAAANPSKVTDNDFSSIGNALGDAGKLVEATEVLTVGMQMHPESVHLKTLLESLGDRAKESGNAEALKELEGLGYGGG